MSLSSLPEGLGTTSAPAAEPTRRSWLKRLGALLGGAALATPALARPASPKQVLDANTFIGEIMLFAGNFAPQGYFRCDGSLLPISQYTALYAILGTTYGGNGVQTFALPNLQGATAIGMGQGPGLTNRMIGEQLGAATTTVLTTQMPAHSHTAQSLAVAGTGSSPDGTVPAVATTATNASGEAVSVLNHAAAPNGNPASPATLTAVGSNQPISLQSPYLVLTYCIAYSGYFPTRA